MADRKLAGPKKGAEAEKRVILFVDEAGFYPLPAVTRTWAPVGETPVLRELKTRDHLSAISAIAPDGKLYLQVREKAFDGDAVVGFLKHLLAEVQGKMLIIWDGAHPPRPGGEGLPGRRGVRPHPAGAAARLCPGPQRRRGHLDVVEDRGTGEPVLLGHQAPAPGTAQSLRAAKTQASPHRRLLHRSRPCLLIARVSNVVPTPECMKWPAAVCCRRSRLPRQGRGPHWCLWVRRRVWPGRRHASAIVAPGRAGARRTDCLFRRRPAAAGSEVAAMDTLPALLLRVGHPQGHRRRLRPQGRRRRPAAHREVRTFPTVTAGLREPSRLRRPPTA